MPKKKVKKSGVGNASGEESLLSPAPSLPSASASAEVPPSTSGRGEERSNNDNTAAEEEEEDLSRLPWVPAPGLPADWLDNRSAGILAVFRSLEKGTGRIPVAALASARLRLSALVAHDVAQAERSRRKAAGQQ